jgi:hypothetical protein
MWVWSFAVNEGYPTSNGLIFFAFQARKNGSAQESGGLAD